MNITLESLIILLIVAGIAGAIGQWLAGYSRGGLLTSIVIGFIGALIGTWVAKQFHLAEIYTLQIGRTTSRLSGQFSERRCSSPSWD